MKKVTKIIVVILALLLVATSSIVAVACATKQQPVKVEYVEVEKEVIVEKEVPGETVYVDREIEVPVEVIKEVEKEVIVEKEVEVPVEVEKIVEVEKEVIVEKEVEKIVEVEKELKRSYVNSYEEACSLKVGDTLENVVMILSGAVNKIQYNFLNSLDLNSGVGFYSTLVESLKYQQIDGRGDNNHVSIEVEFEDGFIMNGFNPKYDTPVVSNSYSIVLACATVEKVEFSEYGTATLPDGEKPVTITIKINKIMSATYAALMGV